MMARVCFHVVVGSSEAAQTVSQQFLPCATSKAPIDGREGGRRQGDRGETAPREERRAAQSAIKS